MAKGILGCMNKITNTLIFSNYIQTEKNCFNKFDPLTI
jgi:hypothetical protein